MADDDLNRLLIESQNVLGTNVRVPFQGQGDIAAGATGGLPAPAATGQGQGAASGRAIPGTGGGPGLPDLAKLLKSLGGGQDLGTRGDTGGTSLSDMLRSLPGLSAIGTGGGGVGSISGQAGAIPFGSIDTEQVNALFQQGFTGDQIKEIMGGLEAVSSGAQGGAPGVAAGAEGAASGVGGAIGGATAGAGGLAAILGLIAQLTGDPNLAKAAQVAGAATSAGSLAGTGAAAAGGFAGAGLGTAAGAAFAPIAAMTLASAISGLAGGEDPVGEGIGEMMAGSPKYQSFVPELMRNEGQQGQAFQTLAKALPLVQSKEELGQLLNSMKHYVTSTTGAPLTGGPEGIYNLQTIAGTGPVTHGQQTPGIDWGPQTAQMQGVIDQLLTVLPGNEITAGYGQPGGGLEGDAAMRLWSQFMDRAATAPEFLPQDLASQVLPLEGGATPALPAGFYSPGQITTAGGPAMEAALRYGQPGYDYAGSGYPAPGQFVGSVSPYWQQLAGAVPGAAPASGGLDSIAAAALATPPGDGAGGMLPEEQRKKLLA